MWSSSEVPLSGGWPPPSARTPSASLTSHVTDVARGNGGATGGSVAGGGGDGGALRELASRLLHHFPCHEADARAHAASVFYSRLRPAVAPIAKPPRCRAPQPRRHHVAVSVTDELLLLHGGELYDQPPSQAVCAEVHLLHLPRLRWSQPPSFALTPCDTGVQPAPPPSGGTSGSALAQTAARYAPVPRRRGHCAQAVEAGGAGQVVLMFGGLDGVGRFCADAWLLEL